MLKFTAGGTFVKRTEAIEDEKEELLLQEEDDLVNVSFTKTELKKTKKSSPGKVQTCYVTLNHLKTFYWSDLITFGGKEAVVVLICMPRKDCKNPESRPVALTSNVCKTMERMTNDRLTCYVENKGSISKYQSGFRRGRNTVDLLCVHTLKYTFSSYREEV